MYLYFFRGLSIIIILTITIIIVIVINNIFSQDNMYYVPMIVVIVSMSVSDQLERGEEAHSGLKIRGALDPRLKVYIQMLQFGLSNRLMYTLYLQHT